MLLTSCATFPLIATFLISDTHDSSNARHVTCTVKKGERWQRRKQFSEVPPIFSLFVTIDASTKQKRESSLRPPWQGLRVREGHESSSCSTTDTGHEWPATSSAWHSSCWSSPVATMRWFNRVLRMSIQPNSSKGKVSFTAASFRRRKERGSCERVKLRSIWTLLLVLNMDIWS